MMWQLDSQVFRLFDDMPKPKGRRLSEFFKVGALSDNYAFCRFAGLC